MDPDKFSFSKKPVSQLQAGVKRQSVISAIMPESQRSSTSSNQSQSTNNTTSTNNNNHHSSRRAVGRTFSTTSEGNLVSEVPADDPLLDYDEQIRAPKFQSKKSLDDIGSVSRDFNSSSNEKAKDAPETDNEQSSPLQHATKPSSSSSTNTTAHPYQPAEVELLSRSFESHSPTPSTSLANNYTLSHYITSYNLISNLDPSTTTSNTSTTTSTQTSPLSSKKNSDDSMILLSKKTPRFTMAPIRTINDPRTPNYIPCVLRPSNQENEVGLPYTGNSGALNNTYTSNNAYSELSRDHWQPNSSRYGCFDCGSLFSLMNRRHHCRKCGEIFCSNCLLSKAKLNFDCKFDVNGILSKVCFGCGKDWGSYLVESYQVKDEVLPDFKSPNKKKHNQDETDGNVNGNDHEENLGTGREVNVPADWTWSSF